MPAAIILAAGASSRFGADKLTSEIELEGLAAPLAVHALRPWLEVFERVVLVLRPEGVMLREALSQRFGESRFNFVICEDAEQGMSASLADGIQAAANADGWLIGLADMPRVPAHAIEAVRSVIANGILLAAPFCRGRRGHPVGFGKQYRAELTSLHGDQGARRLLQRDAERIHHIEIPDQGILLDIDEPADLLTLNNKSL